MNSNNRTNSPAHLSTLLRVVIVACTTLAVLVCTLAVLTGADVVPAEARPNDVAVRVGVNGVPVAAGNYARTTIALCPQATTVVLRFRNRHTGRPLAHRHYTLYWYAGGPGWRRSSGTTSRSGVAARHIGGRVSAIQVSATGYNHYFAVRYRTCTTSVARVRLSKPFGVRGDRRAHVRVTGVLFARRINGTWFRFGRGRVVVRDDRTRGRVGTLRAAANGRFAGDVPVAMSSRLTLSAIGGPTGSARPVSYGRRWVPRPTRTAVVWIPAWMRRRVRVTVSAHFSPQVRNYTGGFADPAVMRVGRTYYAASTTGSDLNLPLMTSKNLLTWRPRAALPNYFDYSSWPNYNDALAHAPSWAAELGPRENVRRISQWAPSLARVRAHKYVAAFSAATTATSGNYRHSCIGMAVAWKPAGPYWALSKPLLCDPSTPYGVIDPDIFVDPRTHAKYLVWAAEGIPHRRRAQLAIRQLDRAGTGWAKGSRRRNLLTYSQGWEGVIMENPSMIRYRGTLYLFYSANSFETSRYATGYAICRSVAGPCRKVRRRPLLATSGAIAGPGGADAFVDAEGHLRLAYAAWRRGHVGQAYPGRTLHIATLRRNSRNGTLAVARLTLRQHRRVRRHRPRTRRRRR